MRKNKYTVYELQDEIKKIWSEELGKDLKINENYFLIGGNSLNAIRIVGGKQPGPRHNTRGKPRHNGCHRQNHKGQQIA